MPEKLAVLSAKFEQRMYAMLVTKKNTRTSVAKMQYKYL